MRLYKFLKEGSVYLFMVEMFEITTENIDNRPLTFVDLSSSNNDNLLDTYWDEDIEQTIVKRIFQAIYQTAKKRYETSKLFIMLDEAHRFATTNQKCILK
jgi:DNA helicase HerA-like ATPase